MISTAEITMRQGRKIVSETTIHLPAPVFTRDVASSVLFVAGTTTARGGKDEKEADEYNGISHCSRVARKLAKQELLYENDDVAVASIRQVLRCSLVISVKEGVASRQ